MGFWDDVAGGGLSIGALRSQSEGGGGTARRRKNLTGAWSGRPGLKSPRRRLEFLEELEQSAAGRELFGEAGESRAFTSASDLLRAAGEGRVREAREMSARSGLGRSYAESISRDTRYGTEGGIAQALSEAIRGRSERKLAFGMEKSGVLGSIQESLFAASQQRAAQKKAYQMALRSQLIGIGADIVGTVAGGAFGGGAGG